MFDKSRQIGIFFAVTKCDPPPNIENGRYDPVEDTYNYLQTIQYFCHDDFTLIGSKTSSCSDSGRFHASPPECKSRFAI